MRYLILFILIVFVTTSCQKNIEQEICDYVESISFPEGLISSKLSEIEFNGGVKSFHFVTEEIGYALLGNNFGGYVEVFKTTNKGTTWEDLQIDISEIPYSMVFKNEDIGLISIHDVSGCPPPNCEHKCVLLRTKNGGVSWEEYELSDLKGVFTHLYYNEDGYLYGELLLGEELSLLVSKDNGETWELLYSLNDIVDSTIRAGFQLYKENIYFITRSGQINIINKKGDLVKTIESNLSSIHELRVLDENTYLVSTSSGIISSSDQGQTWTQIYAGSVQIVDMLSLDEGILMVRKNNCLSDSYSNQVIAYTTDGGETWLESEESSNLISRYKDFQKLNEKGYLIFFGNELIEIKLN